MHVGVGCCFLLLNVNIYFYLYIKGYICLYGEECKLLWICTFSGERKRRDGRRGVSVGLSQWWWTGGGLLRGQWWPWRWGPGCGWCCSFCRARVHPEGSIPGCRPPTAGSRSPAGHRRCVSPQSQVMNHTPWPGTVRTHSNEMFPASVKLQEAVRWKHYFGFGESQWQTFFFKTLQPRFEGLKSFTASVVLISLIIKYSSSSISLKRNIFRVVAAWTSLVISKFTFAVSLNVQSLLDWLSWNLVKTFPPKEYFCLPCIFILHHDELQRYSPVLRISQFDSILI